MHASTVPCGWRRRRGCLSAGTRSCPPVDSGAMAAATCLFLYMGPCVLMRCGRAVIRTAGVKASVGILTNWTTAHWTRTLGFTPVLWLLGCVRRALTQFGFVMSVGSSLVTVFGLCMGTRMRSTRGELLNCLGALSCVIPCLSCPLFVFEQGITIFVCVQIC